MHNKQRQPPFSPLCYSSSCRRPLPLVKQAALPFTPSSLRLWTARLAAALSCIMRLTKFLIVLHRYAKKGGNRQRQREQKKRVRDSEMGRVCKREREHVHLVQSAQYFVINCIDYKITKHLLSQCAIEQSKSQAL